MSNPDFWRRDPAGIDKPHDVLAADEFGIGTRDERLPPDPNRFDPPHDILAAEEFSRAEFAAGRNPATEPSGCWYALRPSKISWP